jgi:Na+/H+-dicarboxylate symporter
MDMIRTAVNVSGDAVVTTIVAKSEGKIDSQVFNDANLERLDTTDAKLIDAGT